MNEFRVGIIGIGRRGVGMIKQVADIEGVKIVAVCDTFEDRIDKICGILEEKTGERPALCTTDYNEIIASDLVDVVMVFAAWEGHIPMCIKAMKAGKPVAVEVAGAYSVEQCWDLVRTYEETKTPIMMLENCCYGRVELMLLNMAEQGLFGTIVHCNGAYRHDVREQIVFGGLEKGQHYRFRNYKNRCCENYPTHALGPIAKILKINHGNRLDSLVSMASKSAGVHDYIAEKHPDNQELMNTVFKQGDVVTTAIKCSNGETITLTLNTTTPTFYTRDLKVIGSKACYDDVTKSIFVDGIETRHGAFIENCHNNAKEYIEKYDHPIWKKYESEGIHEGHGGMDWLVLNAFFDALKNDELMPIDVYDMATWMAITPLTEKSIKLGTSVEIPDFTNGKWVLD